MGSISRNDRSSWWVGICWPRNAAITNDSSSWPTARQNSRFFCLIGSDNEAGVDWQSTVYDVNAAYSEVYTTAEIVRRNNYHAHLFTYENDYFQFVQGLMPQQVWEAKLVALEFIYNQCDMRDLMNYRKNWFPAGFVEIINTLNDKC